MGPEKKEEKKRIMMTIGKFAGKFTDEIPSYYLKWIAENWKEEGYKEKFVIEADKEWQFRERTNTHFDD
jgi:uncharacterized protein (DUF3820 family)